MLPHTAGQGGEHHFSVNHSLCLTPTPYTYTLNRNCKDDKVMRIFSKNQEDHGARTRRPALRYYLQGRNCGFVISHFSLLLLFTSRGMKQHIKGKSGFSCSRLPLYHLVFGVSSCSPTTWAFIFYLHSTSSLFWSAWTDHWASSQKGRAPSTSSLAMTLGNPGLCLTSTQVVLLSDILESSATPSLLLVTDESVN